MTSLQTQSSSMASTERTDSHAFLARALADPQGYSVADLFHLTCDKFPTRTAIIQLASSSPASDSSSAASKASSKSKASRSRDHGRDRQQRVLRTLSFKELDEEANLVSHYFHAIASKEVGQRTGAGSEKALPCVGLYLENCAEYIILWLGLTKAGWPVAFLNHSVRGDALVHSLKAGKVQYLLYPSGPCSGEERLRQNVAEVEQSLSDVTLLPVTLSNAKTENLLPEFKHGGPNELLRRRGRLNRSVRRGIRFTDVFGYVYTSGTTGLPKAVNVTHLKQWNFARGYGVRRAQAAGRSLSSTKSSVSLDVCEEDVVYSAGLPLYHSSGTGIGTGLLLHYGCAQVIRRKFSASEWLEDLRVTKATVVQYIGEICRYVLNQHKAALLTGPEREFLAKRPLKLACGNGLSREIWVEFQQLFQIQKVCEFYGSTEGNGAFRNVVLLEDINKGEVGGVGCIGQVSVGYEGRKPVFNSGQFRILCYDVGQDELVRDSEGSVVDCGLSEPGECVFRVDEKKVSTAFVGYTSEAASAKKLLTETVGQQERFYVRTGDLLSVDREGRVRFVDRIGDTFRWKGENVATAEVASQLSKSALVEEVNVYGVQVPGVEGRAGCAALVLASAATKAVSSGSADVEQAERDIELLLTLKGFLAHARRVLPSYAVPLFVRIQTETEKTGTFKQQKVKLRQQGTNVESFEEPMFWLHPETKTYQRFTKKELDQLKLHRSALAAKL